MKLNGSSRGSHSAGNNHHERPRRDEYVTGERQELDSGLDDGYVQEDDYVYGGASSGSGTPPRGTGGQRRSQGGRRTAQKNAEAGL